MVPASISWWYRWLDSRAVAKPGQIVRVRVLEVDKERRRIALTMRLDDSVDAKPTSQRDAKPRDSERGSRPERPEGK